MKMNIIELDKKEKSIIQFKYSYDDEDYQRINVEKRLKRGERRNSKEVLLSPKYKDKRSISKEKKNELLSFCKSFVIPPEHWSFYQSLTISAKVKDILPLPDVLEEDEDSE